MDYQCLSSRFSNVDINPDPILESRQILVFGKLGPNKVVYDFIFGSSLV